MSVTAERVGEHDVVVSRISLSARAQLAGLVVVSVVVYSLLARLRAVPTAFPDEYLYSALGRSLAAGNGLSVRGTPAHFPALLEPLLTAPAWWLPHVEQSLRAIQIINSIAVSLAAIPAYILARRVRLAHGTAFGIAVLTVVVPQLTLSSQVLSEPVAYPLALGAIAAAVALIDRPSRRATAVFLLLAVLATLARVQLAVIPACALAAVFVDGAWKGGIRSALRRQRVLVAVVVLQLLGGVALAASGRVGYYATLLPSRTALLGSWKMAPVDLYVVLISTGIVIVPAALVGGALALVRPRFRAELAFAVASACFTGALLAESVLFGDVKLLQERYLFYAVPLLAIAFGLRMTRTQRRWHAEAAVAAGFATFAAVVPLAGYVAAQTSPAPVQGAIRRLELALANPGKGSLLFAVAATLAVAVGIAAVIRRRGVGTALLAASALFAVAVDGRHVVVRAHDEHDRPRVAARRPDVDRRRARRPPRLRRRARKRARRDPRDAVLEPVDPPDLPAPRRGGPGQVRRTRRRRRRVRLAAPRRKARAAGRRPRRLSDDGAARRCAPSRERRHREPVAAERRRARVADDVGAPARRRRS